MYERVSDGGEVWLIDWASHNLFIINLRCPLKFRNISRGFTGGMLLLQNGIGRIAARTSTSHSQVFPGHNQNESLEPTLRSLTWQVITENRYKATKKWWPAFSCFGIFPIMRLMLTTFLFLALSDVTLGIFFNTPVRNMTIKSPHELFYFFVRGHPAPVTGNVAHSPELNV